MLYSSWSYCDGHHSFAENMRQIFLVLYHYDSDAWSGQLNGLMLMDFIIPSPVYKGSGFPGFDMAYYSHSLIIYPLTAHRLRTMLVLAHGISELLLFLNLSHVSRVLQYRKTSHISRTLVGNKIVDNSDVVGASPVGAAPTTSSFSTLHLASMDGTKTTARLYKKHLNFGI